MAEPTEKTKGSGHGWGVRHVITGTLFLCLAVNYILRVNLGVAVVVMTDQNRTDGYPIFDWSPEQKGLLLSSFFTGYLISNLVGGLLATKYSNKMLLLGSVSYQTVVSFATPTLVTWGGFTVIFIIRVSMGLVQGFMMPVTQSLLSRWIPPDERSRCGAFALGGLHAGTILSFVGSGFLSESSGGWPRVFHVSALLGAMWCLIWYKFSSDGPNVSKVISENERMFINKELEGQQSGDVNEKKVIPWKKIFTNKTVHALAIAMSGQNFGYWILITQIPSYFAHVLHFETSKNGMLSAMPYVCLWAVSLPISFLSDYLITKGYLTIGAARKLFNTIGQWGAAATLVVLAYTTDPDLAVGLYMLAVVMLAFTFVGFNINVLDIAPNFAGLVMGTCNAFATIFAILSPAFVGFVVVPLDNAAGWKLVFLVAAGMFFLGNLIFVVFGSGEVQDFNIIEAKKNDIDEREKQPLKA